MNKTPVIEVQDAAYVDGFRLRITFSDGENKIVDFSEFITSNNKTFLSKYKNIANFKRFRIEDGNVVWGKDWDLIFPVQQLYAGKIL